MLTTVNLSGLGLGLAPSLPCMTQSKTKAFYPRRTVVTRASSSNDPSSSDDNLPSSSSLVPDTLPVAGVDTDWRAFRARLVASSSGLAENAAAEVGSTAAPASPGAGDDDLWAHNITTLESGCLLLASPQYFTHSQTYFNQSVILIAEHSPEGGTYGFIINKPTEHRISSINHNGQIPEELNSCTLYFGGDIHKEAVSILHGVNGLQGTREIVPGVFFGGISGLAKKVAEGELSPSELKITIGLAGWGPGQLKDEVARGVWVVASASKNLILELSQSAAGGRGQQQAPKEDLWHQTLQLMGGDYAGLSAAVKETYRADIMGVRQEEIETSMGESDDEDLDLDEPRGGGEPPAPSSPSSSKGPWKPPRRDIGHNHGSGI